MTERLTPTSAHMQRAADLLANGALVAFPTETVYGLGADARNGRAVAEIYAAKGRPSFNPLIVHVPSSEAAQSYGVWSETAQRFADAFWPGPLSMVLPLRRDAGLSELVTAGLESVAIRVPAGDLAQELLQRFNGPVAAPSANPSGRISPTTAAHVLAGLDGKIGAVLDGGACSVGLESSIIGLTGEPTLLRAGGVPREAIEEVLGASLRMAVEGEITAPGQIASHYAPNARVRLNAIAWEVGEKTLGFGPMACDLNLSETGDLVEAAANLFGHLHRLDAMDGIGIAVAPIPRLGLGAAINDRLQRAAAPR
ncbi:L-threonylcarbamoyladenylate synthase [Planktotalea frisia]|uniref:Threonylcarbamoyl-AMP synthase n=1 Tax=Planktotalea frisia TaxID=696762 RepID=A0A1L9NVT7_9RHOB|nr:L-threonylcarbamoyladenylate synthase [Planktotalea frisia]OJI93397.1 threonylcarbamoyl-AMP synthase [Planktotalea frisia]PZX35114.1 L-threonylcarbamoyladenylate synthase [Planktotalea frisia]